MAPHTIPLPCALVLPPTSHRDATTPSPCWAPHVMTPERHLFSNPTTSEPRLSPAVTMSDDMLSAPTLSLHCACILQPVTPPEDVAFESWNVSASICLNCFTLAESRKPDLWTCVCVLAFFSPAFAFLLEMDFSFESLFVIYSLSPKQFRHYFNLSTVSCQYHKYWTILILVLCLLCVTPLVCSSYSSFALSSPFFSCWWQRDCELFTHTLVLQGSPSTLSCQPQTTHVFADIRIRLLCRALRRCVEHAPPESCPSFLLVHWAFRACYRNCLPLLHHASLLQNWSIKRPFWGSRFELLDDALMLLISLIFLYPHKILISARWMFKL